MRHVNKVLKRWKEVLIITVGLKIALFLFAYFLNGHSLSDFFPIWVRWDGPHYISLAQHWYQSNGEESFFIVFYPLYPLLIKILSIFGIDFSISAILIPTFFSLTAAIFLYELCRLDFDHKTSVKAVWFLNIFPTALFLQASYTESLFLTLSLATFYFYRKDKPVFSGVTGFFSSFTRINGMLLLPALLFEGKRLSNFFINLWLIPAGFLIYLCINYATFGNFFYFTQPLETHWFKHLTFPWIGIENTIHSLPNIQDPSFYIYASELTALAFIFIMLIFTFFMLRKSYTVYILANLLLFTSTSYILSTPRYILILFPIYIILAKIPSKTLTVILSGIFIALLLLATFIYTQGRWVS